MNFVISNTVPNARSEVFLRIIEWLAEQLDGNITAMPVRIDDVFSKGEFWKGHFGRMGLVLPDDYRIVYVVGRKGDNYTVYNVISRHLVANEDLGDYRADVLVWVNDDNVAIQCKLACI
jgi:hypothetical protein